MDIQAKYRLRNYRDLLREVFYINVRHCCMGMDKICKYRKLYNK